MRFTRNMMTVTRANNDSICASLTYGLTRRQSSAPFVDSKVPTMSSNHKAASCPDFRSNKYAIASRPSRRTTFALLISSALASASNFESAALTSCSMVTKLPTSFKAASGLPPLTKACTPLTSKFFANSFIFRKSTTSCSKRAMVRFAISEPRTSGCFDTSNPSLPPGSAPSARGASSRAPAAESSSFPKTARCSGAASRSSRKTVGNPKSSTPGGLKMRSTQL
mmetsp:Transcript_35974/g.108722  ORF Transcript_35974/g.108722 Transcript_35974/m.108722 type:complete len:224 (-) Transcript_35974:95-766(-)